MDYEQKYKHALDLAKQVYDATISEQQKENISIIFPELKENWNEKIRKEILEYFQQFENEELRGVNISDWIAWLEKQGEQNPFDYENAKIIPKDFAPKVGQKPIWGDKDDSMFQSCIGAVATNDYYKGEEKEQIYDWLKSIKQRIGG